MTRQELTEYRGLIAEAQGIKRQLEVLRVRLESPGAINPGKIPSKGAQKDIRGDLMAAYIDKQALYIKKLTEIENQKSRIEAEINNLQAIYRAILRGKYIEGLPIWKIAQQVQYSEKQTTRLLYKAIEEIEHN